MFYITNKGEYIVMCRFPLKQGEKLELDNKDFTVGNVIGDGSTCIVYCAFYKDNMGHSHRVNIKECFPFNCGIKREGQTLVWNSEEEKNKNLTSFRKTYDKLNRWQDEDPNVKVFDIWEANNTLYIIMYADNGVTFDKDKTTDLNEILKTIKLLTYFVGKYHEKGYLHLDIKPANFLIYPRPIEHIILFDMDTVTSLNDISLGKVNGISYSDNWAAPEQKQGILSKISPATDIFSIGAVLFEKVMGRTVEAADMTVFSEWDFEGNSFLNNVNPKMKRILREIFKKTLAANPKRRYQSAQELIEILDYACNISAAGRPYLIGNCPPVAVGFIGRNKELNSIKRILDTESHILFLHGEGGIGKSSLAIKYGNLNANDYDAVLFLRYRGSLRSLFDEIEIQNCEEHTDHKSILHGLLDEHILLIIDNFDVAIDKDDYLDEVLRCKAKILFTTRTDFSEVLGGDIKQVEVGQLHEKELKHLFFTYSKLLCSKETDEELHKLLKFIDYNTYATELLGRQICVSGWSLKTLMYKIRDGLNSSEKVRVYKDGKIIKNTVSEIIRVLFSLADLNEAEKQILRNMYMLRFLNIDINTYGRVIFKGRKDINDINNLVETGWIRNNGKYYTLHPIIEQLIKHDLNPCEENCKSFYYSFFSVISDFSYCDKGNDLEEYIYDKNCELLSALFKSLDFSVDKNRKMAIMWLTNILKNEDIEFPSYYEHYFNDLYNKLSESIDKYKLSVEEIAKIKFLLFISWLNEFNVLYYIGEEDYDKKRKNEREYNLRVSFDNALLISDSLLKTEKECYINKLFLLVNEYHRNLPPDFVIQRYNEKPELFDLSAGEKIFYGISLSEDEKNTEVEKNNNCNVETETDYCDFYNEKFRKSKDKIGFTEKFLADDKLTIEEKTEVLSYFTDSPFIELAMSRFNSSVFYPDTVLWKENRHVLLLARKFLFSDKVKNCHVWDYQDYIIQNTVNLVIVNAILDEPELFRKYLNLAVDLEKQKILYVAKNRGLSSYDWNVAFKYGIFCILLDNLLKIKKINWIVKDFNLFIEWLEKYINEAGIDFSDEYLFSYYDGMVSCAEAALLENCSEKRKNIIQNILIKYTKKKNELADIDYSLKNDE